MADKVVLALAAHPDDIEFMMAGTLLRLREAGWCLHYMNIANGSCGTAVDDVPSIILKRTAESRDACDRIGAVWHPPLVNDLEVYHTNEQIGKVCSVIRQVRPRIILTQSPRDYMEEHMNACRTAVTAAFCRGMRNYPVEPFVSPIGDAVTLYHAMPHGLRGPLRERIRPGQYVDIAPVIAAKRDMLACHRSQKEWLDKSQGMDAYLVTMEDFAREVGALSGRFSLAEGWRRRSHLGFSAQDGDPLGDALGKACLTDTEYERLLDVGV
jgi:LmbE family N-acetylglucosaminyl deacetylase